MTEPGNRTVAIASDHAGYSLKQELKQTLESLGLSVEDLGCEDESSCDYPDYAHRLALAVGEGRFDLGVLICGTGIGMSMAANRHPGVRAANCADTYGARMTREHNDANVLCIGSRIVGPGLASDILRSFLEGAFVGGKHARRVGKIERG